MQPPADTALTTLATVLKIALLGACPAQLAELAAGLDQVPTAHGQFLQFVSTHDACALPAVLAGCALVLLAGLEAPAVLLPIKDPPDAGHGCKTADDSIRNALALAAVSYRVLYGTAAERLAQALLAVESLARLPENPLKSKPVETGEKKQPWTWMCDKCSDPQCEHRLLTALLQGRASPS